MTQTDRRPFASSWKIHKSGPNVVGISFYVILPLGYVRELYLTRDEYLEDDFERARLVSVGQESLEPLSVVKTLSDATPHQSLRAACRAAIHRKRTYLLSIREREPVVEAVFDHLENVAVIVARSYQIHVSGSGFVHLNMPCNGGKFDYIQCRVMEGGESGSASAGNVASFALQETCRFYDFAMADPRAPGIQYPYGVGSNGATTAR